MAKYTIKLDGTIIRAQDKADVTNEVAYVWDEYEEKKKVEKSCTFVQIAEFMAPHKKSGSFKLKPDGMITTKIQQNEKWISVEFGAEDVIYGKFEDFIVQ